MADVVVTAPDRPAIETALLGADQPSIIMPWLTRMRWFAIVGQIAATGLAVMVFSVRLPLPEIGTVVLLTIVSNVLITLWMRNRTLPIWIIPGVLMFDVIQLTLLLSLTGGIENPFSTLFLVHVALAVVVLGNGWTWVVVLAAAAGYGSLYWWYLPLVPGGRLDSRVDAAGRWLALVLVSGLVAYFIGKIARSLRRRENELVEAREIAKKSEQLAALTTLAAGAAHELGSPLGTIAVVSREMEIGASGSADREALADDARLIREEVNRCRKILDRMRGDIIEDLSQQVSPIGVDALIQLIREDLPSTELDRLAVIKPANVVEVLVPIRSVQQAVGVLIRNAFDACETQEPVVLSIRATKQTVAFEVKDKGPGMPEDVLRRAGQPFFTTKAPGRGMGLGLFLVRLVAERYGGTFRLASERGRGTTSTLEMPQHPDGTHHADSIPQPFPAAV